jgi:hypothetical protein
MGACVCVGDGFTRGEGGWHRCVWWCCDGYMGACVCVWGEGGGRVYEGRGRVQEGGEGGIEVCVVSVSTKGEGKGICLCLCLSLFTYTLSLSAFFLSLFLCVSFTLSVSEHLPSLSVSEHLCYSLCLCL